MREYQKQLIQYMNDVLNEQGINRATIRYARHSSNYIISYLKFKCIKCTHTDIINLWQYIQDNIHFDKVYFKCKECETYYKLVHVTNEINKYENYSLQIEFELQSVSKTKVFDSMVSKNNFIIKEI